MLISQRFVWGDGRPDDVDEISSSNVDHQVTRGGVPFQLLRWEIRYLPGTRRVTEAIYERLLPAPTRL